VDAAGAATAEAEAESEPQSDSELRVFEMPCRVFAPPTLVPPPPAPNSPPAGTVTRHHPVPGTDFLFWDDDEVVAACRCELVGLGFGKQTQRRSEIGVLKCLQGGRAHPLTSCGVATRFFSPPPGNGNRVRW
jgi:hypothetical protein